jgi:hypothetical protein
MVTAPMSDQRDHRTRDVDPFDSPDSFDAPWRKHPLVAFLIGVGVIVVIVLVYMLA